MLALASCRPQPSSKGFDGVPALTAVDLSTPAHIETVSETSDVHLAKNAWATFALRAKLGSSPTSLLKLPGFAGVSITAYQVLPTAVNFTSADFVRQTGEAGPGQVPRVLLPLPISHGAVDLSTARDPAHLADAATHAVDQSILLLIELHSSSLARPGSQTANFELLESAGGPRIGAVPLQLVVDDIDLNSRSRLTIAAPLGWNDLAALCPETFEAVTPRLLSRNDPQHAQLVNLLDQFVALAHDNQLDAYVPKLQPIVKWPPGQLPQGDWDGFDSIVRPWLGQGNSADGHSSDFWPLPQTDSLAGFDTASRAQYWKLAAEHFAENSWLQKAVVVIGSDSAGATSDAESVMLSAQARQILLADPRLRVMIPLRGDRLQFATDANPNAIAPQSASHLLAMSPGAIYPSPIRESPAGLKHWIDLDPRDGSASFIGAGDEQDVRALAALAILRDADVILCRSPLPRPGVPATADQIICFYPGQPYGVDHPLPTLQLKWLRQARQDYTYFELSPGHDDMLKMCRLITHPVHLMPAQPEAPLFTLLTGSNDPHASEHACQFIANSLRAQKKVTGPVAAKIPIDPRTIRWFSDHQQPTLVPAFVRWMWPDAIDQPENEEPGRWIDATVGFDIFNPAEETPDDNQLQWTTVPAGWQVHPQPVIVPLLSQFQVHRVAAHARFNLDRITPESRQPLTLTFVDGFNGLATPTELVLPVAVSERRLKHLVLDGSLEDWDSADALQLDQPLRCMLDRPSLQSQTPRLAGTKSSIYSAWSDDNFYLAFRLGGVTASDLRVVHNFVEYQSGRAWGEDLCELLIQPVYADNVVGPTLHIVCKPSGEWVERKLRPGVGDDSRWEPFEPAGIRYASGVDPAEKIWRAELAIPWQAIAAGDRARPGLLRFNFIQHQQSTGQSASWAGPIDQSRDDSISGLIMLREPRSDVANTAQR